MVDIADPTLHTILEALCDYWERRMLDHIIETGDSPEETLEWMKQTIINEAK
jgi:hypothetical protein